ncbi:MAG: hypothetical protein DCC65_17990 [Planctomycetota bacterium]|nr:MAG: hypothetical protein DCC65_17990 [Planctomycetota bacterium]
MGGEPPNELFDSALAGAGSSPRHKRAAHRRLFHEMVKAEIESGTLSSSRRRALVRFARRLGILPPEAKLIIRAVEYAMGQVSARTDEMLAAERAAGAKRLENLEAALRIGLALLLAVLYCMLARWVFGLVF